MKQYLKSHTEDYSFFQRVHRPGLDTTSLPNGLLQGEGPKTYLCPSKNSSVLEFLNSLWWARNRVVSPAFGENLAKIRRSDSSNRVSQPIFI
jgi:hypothetical protein